MKTIPSFHLASIVLLSLLFSCSKPPESDSSDLGDWTVESVVTKTVDKHTFIFPRSGYAYEHRDEYVQECLDAFESDSRLIEVGEFNDSIKLKFVTSRDEMKDLTGIAASGTSNSWTRTIHFAVFDSTETTTDEVIMNPPIKHEIMHMVSQRVWGYPGRENDWINEGLATYAAGMCSGWTTQELYRFFMENDMLLSMDSITANFYAQDEMIGYHQSAVWVEYLITNYGIDRFRELWRQEISKTFDEIYGMSMEEMENNITDFVLKSYPDAPGINWEIQKEGCYTRLNTP